MTDLKAMNEERDTASILLCLGAKGSQSDDNAANGDAAQFVVGNGHRIPVYSISATKVVSQLRVAVRLEAAARKRSEQLNAMRAMAMLKMCHSPSGGATDTELTARTDRVGEDKEEGESDSHRDDQDDEDDHEDHDDDDDTDDQDSDDHDTHSDMKPESSSNEDHRESPSPFNKILTSQLLGPAEMERQRADEAERMRYVPKGQCVHHHCVPCHRCAVNS
jgi:hypothetical protein